jgi:hypothetical protein
VDLTSSKDRLEIGCPPKAGKVGGNNFSVVDDFSPSGNVIDASSKRRF